MEKENTRKRHGKLRIIIVILILLMAIIYSLAGFITDLMWYRKLGYLSVYLTELVTKLKFGIPGFIIVTLLGVLFLSALKKSFYSKNGLKAGGELTEKRIRFIMWIMAVIFSLILTTTIVSDLWFQILQFVNASEFGVADPLFNKDVGFYIFRLEFLEGLSRAAMSLVVAFAVMTALFYIIIAGGAEKNELNPAIGNGEPNADGVYEFTDEGSEEEGEEESKKNGRFSFNFGSFTGSNSGRNIDIDAGDLKVKGKALLSACASEISILGVLLFLSLATNLYLHQFRLLYSGSGVCYGAGYTDINVTLLMYRVLMVLSVLAAIALVIGIRKRSIKWALILPACMIVVGLVGSGAAGVVQSLIVAPDELDKEHKYLDNNITYTRLAYDLADIEVEDYSANGKLTKELVLDNMETFSNIRINDFDPAEQFYNQTQSIRSYYTFNDVDVDRYYVNGEYTQVFLSAREIDQSRIEDSWLIRHLKYTHGYGVTLSRVDRITSSGQPDMLIASIPPVSEVPEIVIERPEIYYGESTGSYIITNTDETEFDYPSGESNVYCDYEGDGGIRLGLFNRILFAIREGSLKILVSGNINGDSQIHFYRNIMQRVSKIAPFLAYDDDPCVVAVDGRLYWIVDAYTQSAYYPYSEPYAENSSVNYIRNSVKIIVDAYNGDVTFYKVNDEDPIANTLEKIYPRLLKDFSEMPDSLKAHTQYPNAIFNIQAQVYAKYHMTDVSVFYQNEDRWSVSEEFYGQATQQMTPNYFIMKLPGESSAEFVSSIPYTPSGKSNMTGILTARNDGEHYGEIVLYRMPKDRIIYGPAQIEAQINQDAEISKELTLWNNSGSRYSRGNMYAIPVENSILYVEPIYLESSSASLPEVKRVVAFYGEKLAYQPTLAEALDSLFGAGTGDPLKTDNPIEEGHKAAELLRHPAPVTSTPVQTQTPSGGTSDSGQQGGFSGDAKTLVDAAQKLMDALQQFIDTLSESSEESLPEDTVMPEADQLVNELTQAAEDTAE